jgi:hypothetical protein
MKALHGPLLFALAALLAAFLAAPTSSLAKGKQKAAAPAAKAAPAPEADSDAAAADADKDQTKVKIERGAGGKKIYKIEGEIVIEGRIQKPEAFYVLQKSSINYDWHELKQDFVPKILESVTKSPF